MTKHIESHNLYLVILGLVKRRTKFGLKFINATVVYTCRNIFFLWIGGFLFSWIIVNQEVNENYLKMKSSD